MTWSVRSMKTTVTRSNQPRNLKTARGKIKEEKRKREGKKRRQENRTNGHFRLAAANPSVLLLHKFIFTRVHAKITHLSFYTAAVLSHAIEYI